MKRLTDRIAFAERGGELHVLDRLPFLPVAAAAYFALAAICVASQVLLLFGEPQAPGANRPLVFPWTTAIMLPVALWILLWPSGRFVARSGSTSAADA